MRLKLYSFLTAFCLCLSVHSYSYSVLTHEAIVDACWPKYIQPLLLHKFPLTTEAQLKEAHAYVYGGAVVSDMGYYPLESALLSNLIHYVRTGDFIIALLNQAKDLNEYAFALGALSHYFADKIGHGMGINESEPLIYPKVRMKYGNVVTYEQDKLSHVRTEFGFDVLQTARGNYLTKDYHDFIGFKVSRPLMDRTLKSNYGLNVKKAFPDFNLAVTAFRWSVIHLLPFITRAAWINKKNTITKTTTPTATGRNFRYQMHSVRYNTEGVDSNNHPGLGSYIFSFIVRILPRFGKLKALKFKTPGPDAEKLFIKSFDSTVSQYSLALQTLMIDNTPVLPNIDYDTGDKTVKGEYRLADNSYDNLVLKLQKQHFQNLTPEIKKSIISFYEGQKENKTPHKITAKERKAKRAYEKMKLAA